MRKLMLERPGCKYRISFVYSYPSLMVPRRFFMAFWSWRFVDFRGLSPTSSRVFLFVDFCASFVCSRAGVAMGIISSTRVFSCVDVFANPFVSLCTFFCRLRHLRCRAMQRRSVDELVPRGGVGVEKCREFRAAVRSLLCYLSVRATVSSAFHHAVVRIGWITELADREGGR